MSEKVKDLAQRRIEALKTNLGTAERQLMMTKNQADESIKQRDEHQKIVDDINAELTELKTWLESQ